jgi:acyl carrier protein
MTRDEIKTAVAEELENIAPDADLSDVGEDEDLREALDIDSMDFLNFVIAIHQRLNIEIPERDYPKLVTLAGAITYIEAKL